MKQKEEELGTKEIPTGSLSSIKKARQIMEILKKWIKEKSFFLTEMVERIPGTPSDYKLKPLMERK